MQLSRRSWHYRLVNTIDSGYDPHTLCGHFWTVGVALLFMLFAIVTSPIWGLVVLLFFSGAKAYSKYHDWRPSEEKEDGPIKVWALARHRNVCPLIELEK